MNDQTHPVGLTDAASLSLIQESLVSELGLDRAAVVPHARLHEDLDLSSLDIVELLVVLEERTGVRLGAEVTPEPNRIKTVGALADLVSQLSADTPGS